MRGKDYKLLLVALREPLQLDQLNTLASGGVDWGDLYAACRRHGLFPLANRSLQRLPVTHFPDDQRSRFRDASAASMLRSMQLQKELKRLLKGLGDANIPVIPLKGPVLAERLYGDVGLRAFSDLDLLVPKAGVACAVGVLEGYGYSLSDEAAETGLPTLMRASNEVGLVNSSCRWLVEIHWDFAKSWRSLRFPFDKFWAGIDPSNSPDGLDDVTTLLYLCVHGTGHYWDKLKWVVDIDRFIRSVSDLDWDRLLDDADEFGCTRAVFLGLSLSRDCFETPLPVNVMQRFERVGMLPWLKKFAVSGWQKSAERKRPLAQRALFILCCRDTIADVRRSIRSAATDWRKF